MEFNLPSSRADILKIQKKRKRIAIERAKRSAFHAKRLAHIDPDKIDDPNEWRKIPILTKDELRSISPTQFLDDFCIVPRNQIAELWRSGGSTGAPLFYPRTFEDLKWGRLSFARTFLAAGAKTGDTAHVSFPFGIHPVGHVYARAAQDIGIGVNWAGSGTSTPSALQIELIDRLKPTIWLGMSSYGIHLANMAEERGIDLAANPVKIIMCTAEALSDAKRAKISRMWGARVQDNFGMTEAGMMGGESEARDGFHIWTDLFFIEVLNPDTYEPVVDGQQGVLVVTPLFTNNATPFVRWNSGDIVVYREHGATKGPLSIFPVVSHAHRTLGFFKVSGININHQEFEDFMFAINEVIDFKAELVTENDRENLVVSIELTLDSDHDASRDQITTRVRDVFGLTPQIMVLDRGTLAKEFETSIKAPRFTDRRT